MSEQCVDGILEELALVKEQKNKLFNLLEDCNATGVKIIRQRDEMKTQRDKAEQQRDKLLDALNLALEYWAHRQQRYKNRHPVWVQNARAIIAEVEADK